MYRWNDRECGVFNYTTIRAHEIICIYRTYHCFAHDCHYGFLRYGELYQHLTSFHFGVPIHNLLEYTSNVKGNTMWVQMAYCEFFVCKFTVLRFNVEWCIDLMGSFGRSRELSIELKLDGDRYLLKVVHGEEGPMYFLMLDNNVLPPDDSFTYTITIYQNQNW